MIFAEIHSYFMVDLVPVHGGGGILILMVECINYVTKTLRANVTKPPPPTLLDSHAQIVSMPITLCLTIMILGDVYVAMQAREC